MADVLVPPRYETDYLYELRAIAENISRERCQHSEVNTTAAVLIHNISLNVGCRLRMPASQITSAMLAHHRHQRW